MADRIIRSSYLSWRKNEPMCGILNDWYGRKTASRIINKLATQPKHISEIIDKTLELQSNPDNLEFDRIKDIWKEIIPEKFSNTAFPYYVKNKTLYVKVRNSCALMEINMIKNKILSDIKTKLQNTAIEKLIFST